MRRASKFCGLLTASILVGLTTSSTAAVAVPTTAVDSKVASVITKAPVNQKEILKSSDSLKANNTTAEEIWNEVRKYIVIKDGVRFFDEAAARKAGASEDVIAAGLVFNQMVENEQSVYRGVRLPLWGNWCGPGYGGENGAPIDHIDTACMHHDLCYEAQGYFSCNCDQMLIDEINENWDRMGSKEKIMAVATKGFFTIGKLWCKHYPKIQKDAFRLELKQNAWVVARYKLSWDEEVMGKDGKPVLKHQTWQYNDRDRTLGGVDIIDLPSNAKNFQVKITINTGLVWRPWKTVYTTDNLELVKHRSIEIKGTAFRQWVLDNPTK